jgi:signal transduction histidine kinase/ActR/RegA family two-component response regulator
MGSSRLVDVLQILQPFAYGGVFVVALVQWWRRRGSASSWLVATFGVLAAVFVAGQALPEDTGDPAVQWAARILIAVLVLFPYFLYRFTTSLLRPIAWVNVTGTALTASIAVVAFVLPRFPGPDEPTPVWLDVYLAALLVQWVFLSGTVAIRLWRAGRGQPTLARRRMRTLSLGASGLALALVVGGGFSEGTVTDVVVQVLVLVAAPLMLIGFAPPRILRLSWRRKEDAALRAAAMSLMEATTTEEIARTLLPHARSLLGAPLAVLEDLDGQVIASDGPTDVPGPQDPSMDTAPTISIPLRFGRLMVVTSDLTPFFGNEEVAELRTFASQADLAFARNELLESREADREAADRANQAKSHFLSRMSHELRTPMNAVLGFAQLLELDEQTPDQREATEQILKAGKHLLQLIDEVLDIARIEEGRLRLSLEPVDAIEAAGDAVQLLRPQADREGIRLWLETPPDDAARPFVVADRQRLKQVLLNLISNGIKYNREHGTVRVAVELVDGAGRIRIDVADSGRGIPQDRIESLFTPFDRLGVEDSGIEGTGLGLALTKPLVEAMGGTISVTSELGEGSTFSIELAVAEVSEIDDDGRPEHDPSPPAVRKVLYVEDNLSNLSLMERVLARRPGLELLSAMQGSMGVTLARDHGPVLVLLDLNLPDMPGSEVLGRLRADPRTAEIPVVVISADTTAGQRSRILAAGAQGFLTKPFDLDELLELVDRFTMQAEDGPTPTTATPIRTSGTAVS